jgi:hypothetical protein
MVALATNMCNFNSAQRGRVVGVLAAGFAFSSAVVTGVYRFWVASAGAAGDDSSILPSFFCSLAACCGSLYLLGAAFVQVVPPAPRRARALAPDPGAAEPCGHPLPDARDDGTPLLGGGGGGGAQSAKRAACDARAIRRKLGRLLSSGPFYTLWVSFSLGAGCGLFWINNISTIVESTSGRRDSLLSARFALCLSAFNFLGRLLFGATSAHMAKGTYLSCCLLCMALASGLAASPLVTQGDARSLYLPVSLCALAYGGIWTSASTIISELFGLADFGLFYGFMASGPALAGFLINRGSSAVYERFVAPGSDVCVGEQCYFISFSATACVALAASGLASGLNASIAAAADGGAKKAEVLLEVDHAI